MAYCGGGGGGGRRGAGGSGRGRGGGGGGGDGHLLPVTASSTPHRAADRLHAGGPDRFFLRAVARGAGEGGGEGALRLRDRAGTGARAPSTTGPRHRGEADDPLEPLPRQPRGQQLVPLCELPFLLPISPIMY